MDLMANLTVPWRQAKSVWPAYFVRAECVLLGLTQDASNPLPGMQLELWNGKGPGLAGNKPSRGPRSGRKLAQGSTEYGVLGQGYNTLTGFPFFYSGVDPGLTFNPVFDTAPMGTPVSSQSSTSCSEAMTTSVLFNGEQLDQAAKGNLNIPSTYAAAAFTGNSEYTYLAGAAQVHQVMALPSITKVTVGGWELNTAVPVLDSNYITAVTNLANSVGTSNYASMQQSFVNAYGSTYVSNVLYGAVTNTLIQMTSADFGSLQLPGIQIDIFEQQPSMFYYAKGYYTCPDGCPDFNTEQAQLIEDYGDPQTITVMQAPTSIAVPFTSSGGIDCTAYSSSAQTAWDNSQAAPVTYVLGNQYSLMTTEAFLFPESIQSKLPTGGVQCGCRPCKQPW